MSLDRMWAGWRSEYVTDTARVEPPESGETLFEALANSDEPDSDTHVVWRGEHTFAVLNRYPYATGHLLVLPKRAVPELTDLSDAESSELWRTINSAVAAIKSAYKPDGINVGLNMGRGAGAGIPDHLHFHVLPRWSGDTNFTVTVAELRVLPETLGASHQRLVEAWPA